MYANTIPLLKSSFEAIDHAVFVNADPSNKFSLVAVYNKSDKKLQLYDDGSHWFKDDLQPYIEQKLSLQI
jgi:hypothetical protein